MAYPTDVTQPRLGVEAFEENDAASQLSQAAFLLLLGQELKRAREGGPSREAEEAVDPDRRLFRIPRIEFEGRRYSFLDESTRKLVDEMLLRAKQTRPERDPLHDLSRNLAFDLQRAPLERHAASLLLLCAMRFDPVVRVASAAAAFEIAANALPLIAILAESTLDEDPLVRDLSATALSRIYPEHPALRRLAPPSMRGSDRPDTRTSLLVHGTFATNAAWWQPGGDFHTYLLQQVLPDLYAGSDRFDWSGGYSDAARLIAASDLQSWLANHNEKNPLLMGHSHGANVISLATQLGVGTREAVLLSCPVHWPKYAPDFSVAPNVVSIRVHMDLVILADLGGQKFIDPRIRENVLPVWFSHPATHDPAIWQKYNVPAML